MILGENLLFSLACDCSSCLCLHWLLGCPISSAPVWWLATFFPLSYLFLFRHTPQNEQLCEFDIDFINLHPTNLLCMCHRYLSSLIITLCKRHKFSWEFQACILIHIYFLFCLVKPSGGDNLFIRLNGKTWLGGKNWLTLSSWRH